MTRLSGAARSLLAVCLSCSAVVASACGGGGATRYADLVTGEAATSSLGDVLRAETVCADETAYSIRMRPGEELTATVELGRGSRLTVVGCVDDGERPSSARVEDRCMA